MRSSRWVQTNLKCPKCPSSDAYAIDSEGHGYCFVCRYNHFPLGQPKGSLKVEELTPLEMELSIGGTHRSLNLKGHPLADRGISRETCEFFDVKVLPESSTDPVGEIIFPYYNKDGNLCAQKSRSRGAPKGYWRGDKGASTLFGANKFSAGKSITITEGECFPGNAQVLTDEGWRTFQDLKEGCSVLQVEKDFTANFVKPTALIEKEGDGKLLEISCKGYFSSTTKEHNLIAIAQYGGLPRKIPANIFPMNKGDSIPRVVKLDGPEYPLTDDQLRLLIATSADSTFDYRKSGEVYIRTSFKKKRKIERFKALLHNNSIEYTEGFHASGMTFYGFTKPSWMISERFLSTDLLTKTSLRQKELMIEEIPHWDGNFVNFRNQTEYSSKHKSNAIIVQTLCHLTGRCSSIIERSNKFGDWFKVSILHGKRITSCQQLKKVEVDHCGKVYCVTVPSGMILVKQGDKITVTGNCDTLAFRDLQGDYPCVSITSGAQGAANDIRKNLEYFKAFQSVYICFDSDKAGSEAAIEVAQLFPLGKAKIVHLRHHKDANDYLKAGDHKAFSTCWWNAENYTPAGIEEASKGGFESLFEEVDSLELFPWPFDELNAKTLGIRKGEIVTVIAGSGTGKSQFIGESAFKILMETDKKVGMLMLEESASKTKLRFMSLFLNRPLHITLLGKLSGKFPFLDKVLHKLFSDDSVWSFNESTKGEMKIAWDKTVDKKTTKGDSQLWLFRHFGSNDIDTIVSRIDAMVTGLGCEFIFLDHISIVVSDQQSGDERKALDELATKLRTLVEHRNFSLVIVSHLRRPGGKPHEEGGETSLADIRGTAGIGQLSDIVIGLERNGQDPDDYLKNITRIRVLKNRFAGFLGLSSFVHYDKETGRLTEVDPKEVQDREEGVKPTLGSPFDLKTKDDSVKVADLKVVVQ